MIGRIVIDDVRPRTPAGLHPAKAVLGQMVRVSADVFKDGHDTVAARVAWRLSGKPGWSYAPLLPVGNDRFEAHIEPTALGQHDFFVEAWVDTYATWRHKATAKMEAGQEVDVELEEGALLLEAAAKRLKGDDRTRLSEAAAGLRNKELALALSHEVEQLASRSPRAVDVTKTKPQGLWVDRERALFGAWYEVFPRSVGGLAGLADRLPAIAAMGFDVVYLPPIHPVGTTHRKGRNNTLEAGPDDPGSPWAIGSPDGGHTSISPELGTFTDFEVLIRRAEDAGVEIALDYALQCSPDHPWVKEHPEWFHHRPDGSIAYAENPPKKYQDIYPINFWPEAESDRVALWEACREIVELWIDKGVRIFRVDNPHTKPTAFWDWMISAIRAEHPDVLFLAEAFTRPKVMAKLAEVGFSQSYTYFTWRTERAELEEYVTELAHGRLADYMRPNFWPNTPDILAGPLRGGSRATFELRLILAATLVPSYGVYSGFELCENEPASESNEEYLNSEKYEIKSRPTSPKDSLVPLMTELNQWRRRHASTHRLTNIHFHWPDNPAIIAYSKVSDDKSDATLVVLNLDPDNVQEATLNLDLDALGLGDNLEVSDQLSGATYAWSGAAQYVKLDPTQAVAHLFTVRAA